MVMNDELERTGKDSFDGYLMLIFKHLAGPNEENRQ
jgi:hypothetical protein